MSKVVEVIQLFLIAPRPQVIARNTCWGFGSRE
jgi:hypothetical protein